MIDKHGEQVREFYRKQAEARERERIIKLLEEKNDCTGCFYGDCYCAAIALIKGEEFVDD